MLVVKQIKILTNTIGCYGKDGMQIENQKEDCYHLNKLMAAEEHLSKLLEMNERLEAGLLFSKLFLSKQAFLKKNL